MERLPVNADTLRPAADAGGHICPRCDACALRCLQTREEQPVLTTRSGKAVSIDDLGYVQQNREEMEVLFTLLSERYERGSVMLSSNLPFSKWEQIFKDPMTTAAAIDRLIHHSVIIELNKIPSFRLDEAKKNQLESIESTDGLKT